MAHTVFLIVLLILLLFLGYLIIQNIIFRIRHRPVPVEDGIPADPDQIATHLSQAIQCKTVPLDDTGTPDPEAFKQLHAFLKKTYPLVHKNIRLEVVNGFSLLYIWEGTNPKLEPIQLMAHQDVVSADPTEWTHPPFEGKIVDGFVWGRGSLDIKNQLIGILEAAEELLRQGYKPERTIHFAFGHDEETGGVNGAAFVGKWLQEKKIHLSAIVDEGGGIVSGMIPEVKPPVALIGVGEKGYLTIKFHVRTEAGHSSAPPRETSINILARGIARVWNQPIPSRIGAAKTLFTTIGPYFPLWEQVAWHNLWLFGPFLKKRMDRDDTTRAYIRTTSVVTIFHAGTEDNTIPEEATAYANFRLLPNHTIAEVMSHIKKYIGDDRITFTPVEGKANEAVGPSPTKGSVYKGLQTAIHKIYGNYPDAPFVMLGGTDCGHYVEVCENIYRFTPVIMDPSFEGLEHGVDERIPVVEMVKAVKFYGKLMQVWGTETMGGKNPVP
jgi:carboxypeptidase PM20D1